MKPRGNHGGGDHGRSRRSHRDEPGPKKMIAPAPELEDQLQSELHFARWRGISGYLARCRVSAQICGWTGRPREDGCRGRAERTGERKIRVVQDIKEFGAKLKIPVLANPGREGREHPARVKCGHLPCCRRRSA